MGSDYFLRDLDPFAFDLQRALSHCGHRFLMNTTQKVVKVENSSGRRQISVRQCARFSYQMYSDADSPAFRFSNMPDTPESHLYDAIELIAPPLRRRLACWMYEGMLLFAVTFIGGYLFSSLSQTKNALDNRHALQAFLFVILGIYFTWFWAKGQTLAMKTWHIKVVDVYGQPLSQHRALVRYFASWLWFLPSLSLCWIMEWTGSEVGVIVFGWILIWALLSRFHPQQQYWHDVFAGTRLIATSHQK